MTRASGSVPEKRTSTRPEPSKAFSQAAISRVDRKHPVERTAFAHAHVHQLLRIDLQTGGQFVEALAGSRARFRKCAARSASRRRWWRIRGR